MSDLALSKAEYRELEQQAKAYHRMTSRFFESIIREPVKEVVKYFRKTDLYTDEFLKDT